MMNMLLVGTVNVYLFKDFFGNASFFSIFGLIQTGAVFAMMPLLKPLVGRFSKKEVGAAGIALASVMYFLLYLIPNITLPPFIVINVFGLFGFSLFNLIIWAFITDAIDYQEYLTGQREDRTVYAVYSFARKVGQAAFAGGLGGYALELIGYNSEVATQTQQVKDGIYTLATLVPALFYLVIALIIIFIYPLNKSRTKQLVTDLAKKREAKLQT